MIIEKEFNMENSLVKLGYELVDREQESLAVKDDVRIYYYSANRINSIFQIGMVVFKGEERIYDGLMPYNEALLINLLELLLPSESDISGIEDLIQESQQ